MRNFLVVLTIILVLAPFTLLANGSNEKSGSAVVKDKIVLRCSNNLPDENVTTKSLQWFADTVKERTNGRIEIKLYNNSVLGDAISALEQLQYGGLDMTKADIPTMTNFVDDYNALMMPYIYRDTPHFWAVHEGSIGTGILRGQKMKDTGLYGLTYYDGGTRCFYNSKNEIHSPADMEGYLVRVQESELMMSMVEALGGQAVTTAYSEMYSALQTGVADVAENSIVNYLLQSHFEVAPYFTFDHHTRSADILVMSQKTRAKLSEADLKIIDDTAIESWKNMQRDLWASATDEAEATLKTKGVTFTTLSTSELNQFSEACKDIWYSFNKGKHKDLVDQIVAVGK